MPKQVTFQMKGNDGPLTVGSLIDLLERSLDWLRSLDPSLQVEWTAKKLKLKPPYKFTFENASANGPVSSRLREFHGLSSKQKSPVDASPPRFTESEMESSTRLTDIIGHGIREMRITSPGDPPVKFNRVVAEKVQSIAKVMRSTAHHEWTSVRGMLYEVTISGAVRNFKVKHQLTGASIPCTFTENQIAAVKDALPARVEVFGRARFSHSGQPVAIEVQQFRMLPKTDLKIDEFRGTIITDGVSSREHVERIRRAQ